MEKYKVYKLWLTNTHVHTYDFFANLLPDLILFPKHHKIHGLWKCVKFVVRVKLKTHAGQPTAITTHARIVLPLPYPKLLNIVLPNKGNPKPQKERRHDTDAMPIKKAMIIRSETALFTISRSYLPEAAYSVNTSTMYTCIAWNARIIPAPTKNIPWKYDAAD